MNVFNSIFDGLLDYEKLMLICGFLLFVFALAAITLVIVQRRDFKMAMGLINQNIRINAAVLHAASMGSRPTEH